jgi:hypothetical protein
LSGSTFGILLFILVLLILIVAAFWGTTYLVKRATRLIIRDLRKVGAVSVDSAVTADLAGIKKRSIFQPGLLRDYKPTAFQFLIKNNVLRTAEEGKYYLSEETLVQSGLDRRIGLK